jgi:hypothetical protein
MLLPRSFSIFEQTGTEDRTSEPDFLDLDVYGDLDHMPLDLKRAITGSLRVMHGYCEVFGRIIACLKEGRAPTASLLDRRIRYSWGIKNEDAKTFLLARGQVYVSPAVSDPHTQRAHVSPQWVKTGRGRPRTPRIFTYVL